MKPAPKVYEVLSVKLAPAEMRALRRLAARRCLSQARLIAALVSEVPNGAVWIGAGAWTGWRLTTDYPDTKGRLALVGPDNRPHFPRR